MEQQFCKVCKTILLPTYTFCPTCGTRIKEVPITLSLGKQIGIYLLSFFLPPLGLFPALRYIRKGDDSAKRTGVIAIIITIIAVIISLWAYFGAINLINKTLNQQLQIDTQGY